MVSSCSPTITYSPAITLVPTHECFNRCSYCNFRVEPGQDDWLTVEAATEQLQCFQSPAVIEVLMLSGEVHPAHPRRAAWFQRIYDLCERAIALGFLPHTNAGPLSYTEMAALRRVNVSMGLMLEQVTPALLNTVHRHAPSKQPDLRLQQLDWAGELRIPFTTGLLLGLGETEGDRVDTLRAIAASHDQWGHIQEVIVQPHQPGTRQALTGPALAPEDLIACLRLARQHLPADITLQVPPNLILTEATLMAAIAAGAQDLGGISPVDVVNPDYPHPTIPALKQRLAQHGYNLVPRLPVYAHYDTWLPQPLQALVTTHRDRLRTRSASS